MESIGIPQNNMPELPEVETIKNVLKPIFIGHTFTRVEVLNKATLESDISTFTRTLEGQKVTDITRMGKYLIFHISNDYVFISHLRMEGKYFEYDEKENNSPYCKVVFHLDNGRKVCYDDSRGFGKMKLSKEESYKQEKELAKLGPEPFYVTNVEPIMEKVKKSNTPIKTVLLDQTLITGLGNIYVDETLYACKIHPHTPARLINKSEWEDIIKHSSRIMSNAIKSGGSTIKTYHPGKGIDGNFQNELQIYGRKDHKCPNCGKAFRFIKTNGRGTTFCPTCQNKKGNNIIIGLTGKVSSGKTSVLNIFKENQIPTISCDDVVNELYKSSDVASKISRLLGINFPSSCVDKKMLLNYILTHPRDKRKLEQAIFPLVINEVKSFISKHKKGLVLVEAPRLFEANMESLFDTIIVVEINEKLQRERLALRNGNKAELLLELNKDNTIDKNKNKAEFLVSNNLDLLSLTNDINKIINILKSRLG